ERIIKGVDVPIIPVNLDGVWGSIFSFAGGRFLWKFPRRVPYPVRVTFGKPLPSTTTSPEVRRVVQDLGAEAFERRKKRMHILPGNLNYTASTQTLASCAQQCNLKTVVTARIFLEKVKVQPPGEAIFIEDVAKDPGFSEKLAAALAALFLPARALARFAGSQRRATLDDMATIIFSSGSTGDPKGVVLTHYNIASNVEQLNQVFMLHANDRILGILPFFHSFGFTGTLCLPAAAGIGVVFH